MHLHGVEVITELYFAILAAFESRSEVIQSHRFGTNRKRIYIIPISGNLDPILHRFRDTAA